MTKSEGPSSPDPKTSSGDQLNADVFRRNAWVSGGVVASACFLVLGMLWWLQSDGTADDPSAPTVHFDNIIDPGFTDIDQQSALAQQDLALTAMSDQLTALHAQIEQGQQQANQKLEQLNDELRRRVSALETAASDRPSQVNTHTEAEPVSSPPPMAPAVAWPSPEVDAAPPSLSPLIETPKPSIPRYQSLHFHWAVSSKPAPLSLVGYVPSGSFVSAIVTGGADTNAGVLAQGDTVPLVFQTLNAGVLPNGQPSKLNHCTITASAYGEVSSSRGIVRTDRISCVLDDGAIIDQPVKGTAFNFGRNGIRGTTLLKNGDIVQMAGIAGILTGLGETGKALSEQTTLHPLGSTQTLKSDQAPLNLLGHAGSTVGAKLSDYYIKLAETYHPIVEINPGTLVNIVFLEGFALTPLTQSGHSASRETIPVPSHSQGQASFNPLADELRQEGLELAPSPSFQQELKYE